MSVPSRTSREGSVDTDCSPASPTTSSSGFADLGLHTALLRAVSSEGYRAPTPIQAQAIPPALAGRDVLGCARTGTGKTAAFVLPMLQRLLTARRAGRARSAIGALVLAPTRELASQITDSIARYGYGSGLRAQVVFGGVSQQRQVRALQRGVDVLVATPGRLLDLVEQDLVRLDAIELLVLDEFDRMLDQGFLPAIRRLVRDLPRERQTLLFSATMPRQLESLVKQFVHEPVCVTVSKTSSTPDAIDQRAWLVDRAHKRGLLERILHDPAITRAVVFTRTKHGADRVVTHLVRAGIDAEAIHGNKSQPARERTLGRYRQGDLRVLVATDIAARGIDVDDISHVINFDLPADPDNYVHRIGRTARAGRSGAALSLCSADERSTLARIERLTGQSIALMNEGEAPTAPAPAPERSPHAPGAAPRGGPRLGDRRQHGRSSSRSSRSAVAR